MKSLLISPHLMSSGKLYCMKTWIIGLSLIMASIAHCQSSDAVQQAADQGDADSQVLVGETYLAQTPPDYGNAMEWLKKAAAQGNLTAECQIGIMYYTGEGVPKDPAKGMEWFKKAADQGDSSAQLNIGAGYEFGTGLPQDYSQAMRWYKKAAEQGNIEAEKSLGRLYEKGEGVPQDSASADEWYSKANTPADAPPLKPLKVKDTTVIIVLLVCLIVLAVVIILLVTGFGLFYIKSRPKPVR